MLQYLPLVQECNMSGISLEGLNSKHSLTNRTAISSYKPTVKTMHMTL